MNPDVLIVTSTAYGNTQETRFRLALRLVEKAVTAGYRIIVLDNSRDREIANSFSALGAKVFACANKTFPGQRREAFSLALSEGKAASAKAIFWTEPEKESIIREIPTILAPILSREADIVIPSRTPWSLASYPEFQQKTEGVLLSLYKELTGINADPFFGPVAYSMDAADIFANCDLRNYGRPNNPYSHLIAPIEALRAGYRIGSVWLDFRYPPEQKAEEEGRLFGEMVMKRLWQQEELALTILAAARMLGFISRPDMRRT